ncbi:glycosyltransferase family 2 protein [soil metagenome]
MATHAALMLSVVIPMYDEAETLPYLLARLRPALERLDVPYEVIAVDDGSHDETAELVSEEAGRWPQLRLLRLLRNAGHQAAIGAGMEHSRGDYVVTIDADLQDPPEEIAAMLAVARRDRLDVVYGVRSDRESDSRAKRVSAGWYYRLVRRLAGPQVPSHAGDFRLVSRRVLDALSRLPEHGRVYRLVIPWLGFPAAEHHYIRGSRAAGRSKYQVTHMLRLAVDSVTSFSAAPLRIATWAGLAGALLCLLFMGWAVVEWVRGNTVPGWASTVIVVMLLGVIQLLCLGLLGEYVGRLFSAAQQRPTYIVGYDSLHDPGPVTPSAGSATGAYEQRDPRQRTDRQPALERDHEPQAGGDYGR